MKTFKTAAGTVVVSVLLLAAYGVAVEPRFFLDTESHRVEIPDLPADWQGRRVALIADLQIGMWWDNVGMVRKTIRKIISARPALVVIAGDFVYKADSTVVREAVSLVRPLAQAGLPTVAVLGNHDYSMMKHDEPPDENIARLLESELERAGINVLSNESLSVRPGGDGDVLYVAGLDSEWAGRSRPGQALAAVPDDAARIIVMHNPVAYRQLPAGAAPLAIAAHTHAGQIRLKGLPSQSWLDIARPREVVAEGWATDSVGEPGNRLYVNRGIGFSLVPIRIWCVPEITYFTLERAGGDMPARDPDS